VRFLRLRGDVIGPIAHVPVSDFLTLAHPRGSPTPITVPATLPTRDAPQVLITHKVWGLPVVDDAGGVVANFSVSDVRHLAWAAGAGVGEADAALATPVLAFLQERHVATTGGSSGGSLSPVVVRPSDTVSMLVQLLAEGHLHHVYVVGEGRVPQAVLSLTDVMRALTCCMDM
jgi:CBS domain-containing protein